MKNSPRHTDAFRRVVILILTPLVAVFTPMAVFGVGEKAPPAAQPAAPSTPALQPVASEDFHYESLGRRDPFKSLMILQEKKKDVSMLPPIQQVELSMFKVVGMIMDQSVGNKAMLQTPDGKTYIIKKGDIIGKNEGEVISINGKGISIREKFVDFMNKETNVTTILKTSEKTK